MIMLKYSCRRFGCFCLPTYNRYLSQTLSLRQLGKLINSGFMLVVISMAKRFIRDDNWRSGVYKKIVYKTNPNWKLIRAEVLFRDGFRCIRCETGKNRRKLTVHHLVPRSEGGEDYNENLVTLCPDCHDIVEMENLRTVMDIIASYDLPRRKVDEDDDGDRFDYDDEYNRPEWHRYVYGGKRRSD